MKLPTLVQRAKQFESSLPPRPEKTHIDKPFASFIDCALHNPEATPTMIEQLCIKALKYQFATVFVNPLYISDVKHYLEGSKVKVGSIAGFPLGAYPTKIKIKEAVTYMDMGADEIDMVMSIGMLKAGELVWVLNEITSMAEVVHKKRKLLKVIIETALLTKYEKILACLICKEGGADFVKTSTGFSRGGATVQDIDLMRRVVGSVDEMGVKAAGGIHSFDDAKKMIEAGASRIGARLAEKIIEEYWEQS